MASPLLTLLRKEFQIEFRNGTALAGLALYLVSTIFICYLVFWINQNQLSPLVWSALYWIILMFTLISTAAKSFIGERKGIFIYYYSIASPHAIILSKILYNTFLALMLSLMGLLLFALFLGNQIQDMGVFMLVAGMASIGFAASLSLLSAIASKADHGAVLMAVLSFPVIISILFLAIRATKNCIDGLGFYSSQDEILTMAAINCLIAAVSYLLFPYIWRS
jgi:heme exporter protein B